MANALSNTANTARRDTTQTAASCDYLAQQKRVADELVGQLGDLLLARLLGA